MLADKKITLGICGSIAAYKAVDWLRELRRDGAEVQVVMTAAATRFVTPLTFAALSGNRVYGEMFDHNEAEQIPHITLAARSDLIVIAPATAQTIARLAYGMADDLLATLVLANQSPVIICPAMNCNMYLNPATQNNLARIRSFGYTVVEPESGSLACNCEGPGRLTDWVSAREAIYSALSRKDLVGYKFMVTAGPTHEPLDPVRFLSNRSTGRMGFALATTARRRGAEVTLITGPVNLPDPPGVKVINIKTADEMAGKVLDCAQEMDVIVKAAAVSDFRPADYSPTKLKKINSDSSLALSRNNDILAILGKSKGSKSRPILVGFAAESHDFEVEGRRKLIDKNLDLLALNDITSDDAGFAVETNRITLLDRDGREEKFALMSKEETADLIWDRVEKILTK